MVEATIELLEVDARQVSGWLPGVVRFVCPLGAMWLPVDMVYTLPTKEGSVGDVIERVLVLGPGHGP